MVLTQQFHHCALVVANLEEALNWYQEKLDFKIEKRFRIPEAQLEIVNLTSPGELRLELLSRDKPDTASEAVARLDSFRPGAMHICFEVNDIEAAAKELKKRMVSFIQEPKTIQPAGVKNCWILDHEGNQIEFIEKID